MQNPYVLQFFNKRNSSFSELIDFWVVEADCWDVGGEGLEPGRTEVVAGMDCIFFVVPTSCRNIHTGIGELLPDIPAVVLWGIGDF